MTIDPALHRRRSGEPLSISDDVDTITDWRRPTDRVPLEEALGDAGGFDIKPGGPAGDIAPGDALLTAPARKDASREAARGAGVPRAASGLGDVGGNAAGDEGVGEVPAGTVSAGSAAARGGDRSARDARSASLGNGWTRAENDVVTASAGLGSARALRDASRHRVAVRALRVETLALWAKGGDSDAIGELYRRTHARARGTAAVWCDASDVDDAVADGFARALSSFGQLRDPAAVEPWIMRCVARAAIDVGRRRARLRPSGTALDMDADEVVPVPSAAESALAALDRAAVRHALNQIPAGHRELIGLRFHGGLTVREIAERLGAPEGTLRRRCVEASRMLEQTLLRSLLRPASGPCAPITNLLCRGARRELSAASTRKVAAHLRRCPGCRARNDELGEVMASLHRPRREVSSR